MFIQQVVQPAVAISDLIRISISAGVGAVFGIVGSLATEFVKPRISRIVSRQSVQRNLRAEVSALLPIIETGKRILQEVPPEKEDHALEALSFLTPRFNDRLITHYQQTQPDMLIELSRYGAADYFYGLLNNVVLPGIKEKEINKIRFGLDFAFRFGSVFIGKWKNVYPDANVMAEVFYRDGWEGVRGYMHNL